MPQNGFVAPVDPPAARASRWARGTDGAVPARAGLDGFRLRFCARPAGCR